LQSFPDSFVFKGTKSEIARQIGNAVPPLFGKKIAESVLRIFYPQFVNSIPQSELAKEFV
jgi:DNA (cytosine-5)-methyltransferase 1